MRLSFALVLLLLAPMVSGCATFIHGQNQDITVASEPAGAEVYENGRYVGRTPATLGLRRGDDHLLTFRLDGYEEVEVQVFKEVDYLPLASNLLLANAAPGGLVVDFLNGAAYALEPEYVFVRLQEAAAEDDPEPARPVSAIPIPAATNGARRQNGPRFGVTYLTSGVVDRINEVLDDGDGEDEIETPLITQFGWQFETQTFQTESGLTGVVEFVPLIGGLERGKFFPTFTLIAGARTRDGIEVGVGPNVSLTGLGGIESSSNETGIAAGLAIAGGKSFDVGGANVPLNGAIVLGESGARFSLLIGLTTSSGRY